ncbi:MAG: molybdate ABC transporter substrate-binding protein [Muribaculum sp.]|nr:molybdate ABC transporter substrate-binding protein [Muribaculum sp.]
MKTYKKIVLLAALSAAVLFTAGCSGKTGEQTVELTVLAAASLTDVCGEIGERYEAAHEGVRLHFSYGASGALQTQIEEGAPADVFLSAAWKQMSALDEAGLMDTGSIIPLLENKIVLVVPADGGADISSFEEAATDKVGMIGLGEPESVPVGQYSEEVFASLNLLEQVQAKANYGSDVRTVLSWVETGAVDCGVVYATDAYTTEQVKIVAEAPEGSCAKVIYPVGVVGSSAHAQEAAAFVEYLQSEEILTLFESYGFSRAAQ